MDLAMSSAIKQAALGIGYRKCRARDRQIPLAVCKSQFQSRSHRQFAPALRPTRNPQIKIFSAAGSASTAEDEAWIEEQRRERGGLVPPEMDAMCGHTEKIAVATALVKSEPGTTIRIVKDERVCEDCHIAMMIISRKEKRKIICRDSSRLHVFEDGRCSCGNHW